MRVRGLNINLHQKIHAPWSGPWGQKAQEVKLVLKGREAFKPYAELQGAREFKGAGSEISLWMHKLRF